VNKRTLFSIGLVIIFICVSAFSVSAVFPPGQQQGVIGAHPTAVDNGFGSQHNADGVNAF